MGSSVEIDKNYSSAHVEEQAGQETANESLKHETLAEAAQREHISWSPQLIKLYGFVSIMFLLSSGHGYDSSLMSTLLVTEPFKQEFGTSLVGAKTGLITATYQIGGAAIIPFIAAGVDLFGRRMATFLSCLTIIIGTIIQGTAYLTSSIDQYMAGRALLGAGVYATAVGAPAYVVELSPFQSRGKLTGMYNCCYAVGAILAAGVTRACNNYTDNRAWLVPTWCQALFPLIVCCSVLFFPESPRWLFTHGKKEEALDILVKYHGNNNPDSVVVKLEIAEFEAALNLDGSDKKWWDYSALFRSRSALYRIMCNTFYSAFTQWVQGGIGYYIGGFYQSAGVTDPITVLNLNLGLTCAQAVFSIGSATFYDRIPRRTVIVTSFASISACWVGIIVGTAMFSEKKSHGGSIAGITFYWLFQAVIFPATVTPMQALYPSEVLNYEQRGKGMGLNSLANSASSLINQFALPIGLEKIGYKVYIVFCIFSAFAAAFAYFVFPETSGYTLEELDAIFESKHPVKASLTKSMLDAELDLVGH